MTPSSSSGSARVTRQLPPKNVPRPRSRPPPTTRGRGRPVVSRLAARRRVRGALQSARLASMAQTRRSLLAEMALRFVEQREVLATTCLGYILSTSATAGETLRTWLGDRGVSIPAGLAYRTEVVDAEHEGRPDVVASASGKRHLILEGKFWAALTDAQPVGYLQSLEEGGCLLVVTPEKRLVTIGGELVRRCRQAQLSMSDEGALIRGGVSQVADRWWLGTVSWRILLGRLEASLAERGDVGKAADVEQLAGLADLEDQEAFLPVVPSDLAQPTPLRVHQFMELAEAVCRRGVEAGFLHSEGLRPASSLGRYTRYIGAGPIQLGVFVDLRRWARQGTPLWVEAAVIPGSAFADLEATTPPGVFYDGTRGRPVVPLDIPLHVEHDEVLDSLEAQLRQFVARIEGCPSSKGTERHTDS